VQRFGFDTAHALVPDGPLLENADGKAVPIAAGEAVFWAAAEEHEAVTEHGLTALVLEADGLRPPAG
jgi:hypothetical protein